MLLVVNCSSTNQQQNTDSAVVSDSIPTVFTYQKITYDSTCLDTVFKIDGQIYTVHCKLFSAGPYIINDTVHSNIQQRQENFIEITINNRRTIITKDLFKLYYKKAVLTKNIFGTTTIDKFDTINHAVVFTSFFAYPDSDFGELLTYAVSTNGKFHFRAIKNAPHIAE